MKSVVIFLMLSLFIAACSPERSTWLALGDSITYLNDHTAETGNRVTKGYMSRVVEKMPHLRYVNKGFNGWTASRIAREIEGLGLSKADLYTVFLGTNDWWQGNPIGTIDDYKNGTGYATLYGSFRIIIDKLRGLNNHSTIVLITPMQRVDFVYLSDMKNNAYGSYKEKRGQSLSEFADAIVRIGELEKLDVVDLYHNSGMTHENLVRFKRLKGPVSGEYKEYPYPDFIDIPFNPETDEYPYPPEAVHMTYDGLHPSDEGYEVIAQMLLDVFRD